MPEGRKFLDLSSHGEEKNDSARSPDDHAQSTLDATAHNEKTRLGAWRQRKKTIVIVAILLSLLLGGSGGAAYYFFSVLRGSYGDATDTSETTTDEILRQIGMLIVLPEGETPTVATVIDPEKLKDQPFFLRAEEGDKVLIYRDAGKAILYSPAKHKIVEVAPVNLENLDSPPPASPDASSPVPSEP